MDTLENAQKRSEYWKAECLAASIETKAMRDEIKRLRTSLEQLMCATTLHHRNPFDLDGIAAYTQAKSSAEQALMTQEV